MNASRHVPGMTGKYPSCLGRELTWADKQCLMWAGAFARSSSLPTTTCFVWAQSVSSWLGVAVHSSLGAASWCMSEARRVNHWQTLIVASRLFWAVPVVCAACQPAEVKTCRDNYLTTHAQVASVDMNDLESVESAFGAVESNLAWCEKAQLAEETKQLNVAKRKLESQVTYLRQIANRKELTPVEVDELVKKGDPDCPKGQTYQYKKTGKKVRCTGSQILAMNWKEAKTHFSNRGFKIFEPPNGLKAELGSESYAFEYGSGPDVRATCVVVFSQAGIAWQETVTRVSGVMPQRLKEGTPLVLGKEEIPYTLQADPIQAILRFGTCARDTSTSEHSVGGAESVQEGNK